MIKIIYYSILKRFLNLCLVCTCFFIPLHFPLCQQRKSSIFVSRYYFSNFFFNSNLILIPCYELWMKPSLFSWFCKSNFKILAGLGWNIWMLQENWYYSLISIWLLVQLYCFTNNLDGLDENIYYLTKNVQSCWMLWSVQLLDVCCNSCLLGCDHCFVQVGSIIELRRSYQAYNVMPSLSKALRRYGVWLPKRQWRLCISYLVQFLA